MKSNNFKNRLTALALCFTLLLGAAPITRAYAVNDESDTSSSQSDSDSTDTSSTDSDSTDSADSKDSKDDNYVVAGKVTVAAEDDTIKVGSVYYALSADVEVYEVTNGDKIETATLSDLEAGKTVELVINDGEIVTVFWYHAK